MNMQIEKAFLRATPENKQRALDKLFVNASNPVNGQHVQLNWDVQTMSPAYENMTPIAQVVAAPRVWMEYRARQAERERVFEFSLLHNLKRYQAGDL